MTIIDRAPWFTEPSFEKWFHEDLICVAMRMPWSGCVNGYVGIPKTHPLYGATYNARVLTNFPWETQEASIADFGVLNVFIGAHRDKAGVDVTFLLPCHGGITYADDKLHTCSEPRELIAEEHWWFGFDTNHSGDLSPTQLYRYPKFNRDGKYRTFEYTKGKVNFLAQRLLDLKNFELKLCDEVLQEAENAIRA